MTKSVLLCFWLLAGIVNAQPLAGISLGIPFTPVSFIIREDFGTDAPAPSSTLSGGAWTNTSSLMFAKQGKLFFPVTDFDKWLYTTNSWPRVVGRAFVSHVDISQVDNVFGPYVALTSNAGYEFTSSENWRSGKSVLAAGIDQSVRNGSAGLKVSELNLSVLPASRTFYRFALVERSAGGFIIGSGGEMGEGWKLLTIAVSNSASLLRPILLAFNGPAVFGYAHVVDGISGIWGSDFGLALYRSSAPNSPALASVGSNAMLEVTWTPASSETLNLSFRRSDPTHEMIVRCDQAGGTIKLIQNNAGETEIGSSNHTFTVGVSKRIWARFDSTNLTVALDGQRMWFTSTNTFNPTATEIAVSGFSSATNFIAWPIDVSAYVRAFDTPYLGVMLIGDSKSASDPPESYIRTAVNQVFPDLYRSSPARIAAAGRSVKTTQALIDAALAVLTNVPTHVLFNLGVNDMTGDGNDVGDGVTWKVNLAYILDAVHVKWPSAKIWLARVWRQGAAYTSKIALIDDTLIPQVIASRPWCALGVDERIILENGDDGVTMLSDGLHPNATGQAAMASAWATVISQP